MIFLLPCDLSLHMALTCHGTSPDRGSFGSNPWPMLTIVSESFVEFWERERERERARECDGSPALHGCVPSQRLWPGEMELQVWRLQWVLFCFVFFINYLFLAVLGLRFCARAFSSCGERGPLFIVVRGPLLLRPLLLWSTGSRRAGSVAVAHGPSCSAACGIFPDQGSNPCPLHWQADSQPLRHQGSPAVSFESGDFFSWS